MKKMLTLLLCLAVPLFIGFLGSTVTTSSIMSWYALLERPFFSPPNWVFAPVWTLLYLMMGLSSFQVLQQKQHKKLVDQWIKIYSLQLGLNWLWSFVFFGLHQPLWAVAVILLLWGCIATLIKLAWKIDKKVALALIPYLAWVSFATLLNSAIAYLN